MDASFKSWLRAIWSDWFSAMSGPLSVPLGVAAFFVSPTIGKILLGVSSFGCIVFAAYWPWRKERLAHISAVATTGWDWTIRDLLHHFAPKAMEGRADSIELATPIMDHLTDLLSSMMVQGWGREILPTGERRPLELISYTYWGSANFTFWFLMPDSNPLEAHVSSKKRNDIADLRFNKAQVVANWKL